MLKKITTSFVTLIVALLVMLTSTIATPLSVKAETIAANTTSVKDVNEDGIVNVFDLVAMKKSLINDSPSQWSVLDLIQLQKFLLNVQDDNSHRVFDVTNMDVTDQNTWLLRNYFCSDFSKSYVDGFDGSICVYFADGLYEIKFDSSIVSYDSPKFNQAEHICQYYCEEKQETLYVTIFNDCYKLFVESDIPSEVHYFDMSESYDDSTITLLHNLSMSDFPKHVIKTADGSLMLRFAKAYTFYFDGTKDCVVNTELAEEEASLITSIITEEGSITIYSRDGSFVAYFE